MKNDKSEMRKYYKLLLLGFLAFSIIITACDPMEGSFEEVLKMALEESVGKPTVSVGDRIGLDLSAAFDDEVSFVVSTTNIPDGEYEAILENSPLGISVAENVTISNNGGILKLAGNTDTVTGTYTDLTLTINGVKSAAFTLYIAPAGAPMIGVGDQDGVLKAGTAGKANFTVTTKNIASGTKITLNSDGDNGITLTPVTTTRTSTKIEINTTQSTPGDFHPLTITLDKATSDPFYLAVKELSVGTQIGKLFGATQCSVNFEVTTKGIKSGSYAVTDLDLSGITGISPSSEITIGDNGKGTLTIYGATDSLATAQNIPNQRLTIDEIQSKNTFTITILTKKAFTVAQSDPIHTHTIAGGTASFNITSLTSIDDNSYSYSISGLPNTVTPATGNIVITNSATPKGKITLNYSAAVVAGTHNPTLTITSDGIPTSVTFPLTITQNPNGDGSISKPFLIGGINGDDHEQALQVLTNIKQGHALYRLDKSYKQTIDIDLEGVNWTPIFIFDGVYDGNGKTINNLRISVASGYVGGIISTIHPGGIVKNVRLETISLSGSDQGTSRAGGVAGENYGIVQNCAVSGSAACNMYVGGVVGANYGTVKNCSSSVDVTSYGYGNGAGGVVGHNHYGVLAGSITYYGKVENCYATGIVTGSFAGGVVGNYLDDAGEGKVVNCVALNSSIADADFQRGGRVIGRISGTTVMSNNYALSSLDSTDIGHNKIDGADIATGAENTWWTNENWSTADGATAWDFTNIWEWDSIINLPVLRKPPSP